MKRLALLAALLCATTLAMAQEPAPPSGSNVAERVAGPSYTDLHCAGFISKQGVSGANYVLGGMNTPDQMQFAQGDTVFLEGSGYQPEARFSVLRKAHDPNYMAAFPGQAAAIAEVGEPYSELGRVRVTAIRGKTTVALVEFSCAAMVPGDIVVPFQEKPPIAYRPATAFDRFPADTPSVAGRIVMAREFDTMVATGHKVYVNVGADKGVKPGDYFRVVRGYDPAKMDKVDALSHKMKYTEDTQKSQKNVSDARYADLPRRALGEMIVLAVTPTSSTCMVTRAPESINVGDAVELEGSAKQ